MKRQDHMQGNGKIAHSSTFAYSNDSDYLIRTMSITLLALSPLLIGKRPANYILHGIYAGWSYRSYRKDASVEGCL